MKFTQGDLAGKRQGDRQEPESIQLAAAPTSGLATVVGIGPNVNPVQPPARSKVYPRLPRLNGVLDFTREAADERRMAVSRISNVQLNHLGRFSIDAESTKGNIEMLAGCIQVPMAFAGPLLIDGEGMRPGGEQVFVPLATSEGALVASYNRGMRLTREAGGVKTTVIDDQMQRAPCFMFSDARYAKAFGAWIGDNFAMIKTKAESTSRYACLIKLEHFPVGRARHIRFCYATGDAAGQNMTSKATREACLWILSQNPAGLDRFYLSGNMDTDKKHSHLNIMSARGKKVVAECTIPADTFHRIMGASVKQIYQASKISTFGSLYANSSGNGAHIANAVTAIFIATGQDVANVAESQAGFLQMELLPNGSLYVSLTIPSLIVATAGGGTGLPTQRECLAVMGCTGEGKAKRLAQIIAAAALGGEMSLMSAVIADAWVSAHEAHGRNKL